MIKKILSILNRYRSLILLIVIFIIAVSINPTFSTKRNIQNILLQVAVNGMVAVGMTYVIITGGFDLSVGSVMALAGVVAVILLPHGIIVALVAGITVGVVVGLINGTLIAYLGVNPFIASLGMMAIVRGFVMGITDARPISEWNEFFSMLGTKNIGFLPISTLFLIVLIIGAELFLKHTRRGRYIYVYGSNSEAGYLAGINMKKVLLTAYCFCGTTAALAGIWLAARLNTGSPVIADDAALVAITAVILGGTSLLGGSGSVLKTAVGIMILGLISNLMNLMEIASYYQILTKGLLVVIVVAFDAPGLKRIFKKISYRKIS